ncbi:MAG: GumC family protein [bacterium]
MEPSKPGIPYQTNQGQVVSFVPKTSPEEEISLRDYWLVVSKRRWSVITVFVIIVVLTTITSFHATPIYRATTRLQIDSENPNIISIDEVMNVSPSDRDYQQTQYQLLQSRSLARKVIEELDLANSPEFTSIDSAFLRFVNAMNPRRLITGLLGALRGGGEERQPSAEEREEGLMSDLIDEYLGRLQVDPERNTRLVSVSFSGMYPKVVFEIADTHARLFIEHNLGLKFAASTDAIEWLDQHLGQLKKKVEESEADLHRYKEKNSIVSLEERQNIIVQRLSELNSALTRAKTDRIRLETLYQQVTKYAGTEAVIESLPSVINNSLIQELKTEYIGLQAEYNRIANKYGAKHPHIVEITSKRDLIGEKVRAEVQKIINSIKTEYEIALAEENVLKEALEEQKREAMELNKKAIRYGVLKREAESNKEVFNVVLNRLKETDLTRGLKASNITIVDPAELPQYPIRPRKKLNIILAAVIGLMVGVGLAFFFEYLDDTVKTPDDLKRYFGMPFLGPIPHHDFSQHASQKYPELVTFFDPKSKVSEAYKGLRTSILFSIPKEGGKAIMITSAGPAEGKSLTVANLAVSLAQTGNSVCILDCDMRKPRLHKLFHFENEEGLTSVLVGKTPLAGVTRNGIIQGLSLIPCGQRPPNPSELLGSPQMQTLLDDLRHLYDFIIMDSPPLAAVTDSVVLARIADGVCLVIKGGETGRDVINRGVDLLRNAQAQILGAVINNIDIANKRYYYYYQYYYYSYYGDEDEGPRSKLSGKRHRRHRSL